MGEILVEPNPAAWVGSGGAEPSLPALSGYENHAGLTDLGPGATALGRVDVGVGNGDGTEGALGGHVVGTYLHGPALARNPALADLLLSWVLGQDLPHLNVSEVDVLRSHAPSIEAIGSHLASQRHHQQPQRRHHHPASPDRPYFGDVLARLETQNRQRARAERQQRSDQDDIGPKHRITDRSSPIQLAPPSPRNSRIILTNRIPIVCTHPTMITQHVQSMPLPMANVTPLPTARVTIRYCFDITPSNLLRPVTACPSVPTYAVMSARMAAQYPNNGLTQPL